MKKGRSLSSNEKCFLRQQGFNPRRFQRVGKDWESFTFLETKTGKELLIRR